MATTLIAVALGWWIDHQQSILIRQELRSRDALIDAIIRQNEDDAREAAKSLRDMNRGESAVPILLSALRTADTEFSYRAALILGHDVGSDIRTAIPILIEWLHDDRLTVRDHSFLVLRVSAFSDPKVQQAFLAALKHENVEVRRSAVSNLGVVDWRKMQGARTALAQALSDSDARVRDDANSVLKYEEILESFDKMENRH